MADNQQTFEEFLRNWIDQEIVALGPRIDPSDVEFIVKRRASELTEIARDRAWRAPLIEKARPYGDVVDYVRELYRSAEAKAATRRK
jgi:hypothetical protein